MILASTFLSHSAHNKPLVQMVAHELGRLGIAAWLDINELGVGTDLDKALSAAVRKQATLTIFLSPEAIASDWVMEELRTALKKQKESAQVEIFPVYLGDPVTLIKSCDPINPGWLSDDNKHAKIIGDVVDPAEDMAVAAKRIADKLARSIYQRLDFRGADKIAIYLDQRGAGARTGDTIALPDNAPRVPTLVFRTSLSARTDNETIYGADWLDFSRAVQQALGNACGTLREKAKRIYLYGHSQLAFPFLIGHIWDRTTSANLFCYNSRDRVIFDNEKQERRELLTAGNPHCNAPHLRLEPIVSGTPHRAMALVVAKEPRLLDVLKYQAAQPEKLPLVWVPTGIYNESKEVMDFAADLVALLLRLKSENDLETIQLFTDLPFHALPLLAANLRYAVRNIWLMEYRKDLERHHPADGELYVALEMA